MARGPSVHSVWPGDGGVSEALCPGPRQARRAARFLDRRAGGDAPGLRAPPSPAVARRQAQAGLARREVGAVDGARHALLLLLREAERVVAVGPRPGRGPGAVPALCAI